jgi:hypothetical protein
MARRPCKVLRETVDQLTTLTWAYGRLFGLTSDEADLAVQEIWGGSFDPDEWLGRFYSREVESAPFFGLRRKRVSSRLARTDN